MHSHLDGNIGGTVGGVGGTILGSMLGVITVNSIGETVILATVGGVVGFYINYLLKKVHKKKE